MVNRLKEKYTNEIVPSLMEKFNYSSIMQAPKVDKIVINMGVGDAVSNAKNLDEAVKNLRLFLVKNQLLPALRNLSLASVYVKVWRSVPRLPYVDNVCTNFWTN